MVYCTTIHWLVCEMRRIIRSGHKATMTAHADSTTFFQNVIQLLRWTASPKQPQSEIGFAMASHSVSGVINAMRNSEMRVTRRRWMAKSRQMPNVNSNAASPTAATIKIVSVANDSRCMATR